MPIAALPPGKALSQPRSSRSIRSSIPRLISLWISLMAFWLLLSGQYSAFLIAAGAGCSAFVVWLAHRMNVIDHEGHPIQLGLRAITSYWPWLVKEIVKSAWDVSLVILRPSLPVQPSFVRFRPSQQTDIGLVVHANSITLTPGTICIEATADEFLVHALTASGAAGVGSGSAMDERILCFEGTP